MRKHLVEAAGWIREPSPALFTFLQSRAVWERKDPDLCLALRALARLDPARACAQMKDRILSPRYPTEEKIFWFLYVLVEFRNHPAVVQFSRRMLSRPDTEGDLRNTIVDCLFEYEPKVWFMEPLPEYDRLGHLPRPQHASSAVLRELLAIADLVERLDLPRRQKNGVRKARRGIEGILRARRLDHSPRRLARLIADLDADRFAVREQATEELAKLGLLAEEPLERALAGNPSTEAARRIKLLLEKLKDP